MCGQTGWLGTMVAGEIHMNQEVKMQAAASKDKRPGVPENKDVADDPAYENITLTFRKQDKSKGSDVLPKNQVPGRSRSPPDGAKVPPWLYRAILSLYVFLALTFTFCIILLALVLVKSDKLSGQLQNLERELQNASSSMQNYQARQQQIWSKVQERLNETEKDITMVLSNVRNDINHIKNKLQSISNSLQKSQSGSTTQ
ncbi:mast cell-expressed membrane protein 1 [Talpa occidentalis]|uniref:mast cell-expressed membrane protein 1 n=1 Tax=Talpa occidentalis TaxID=50954 RepID=UPI0023F798BB|nr:mast cell-expressed membrane protein 1 [Talpa occidentalis]